MDAVLQKYGRCDILVNNAGWSYTNKPTATVTEEEFERVFDVNVKGVYLGCNAWVDQAIERKEGGVIINIASVGATRPRPGLVWYNASKGAVWNVRIMPIRSLLTPNADLRHIGYKRPCGGIRSSPNSCRLDLSLGHSYRSLQRVHWHGGHPREQAEVH